MCGKLITGDELHFLEVYPVIWMGVVSGTLLPSLGSWSAIAVLEFTVRSSVSELGIWQFKIL